MCIALPGKDFIFTEGTKLHFRDINQRRSFSFDQVEIPIIDDDIAEPRESFICSLQAGNVDDIQAMFPSQVTIEIRDNDGECILISYSHPHYNCMIWNDLLAINDGFQFHFLYIQS